MKPISLGVMCLALQAQALNAQTGNLLTGPAQGFAFDLPSHSLRPFTGALGSANLGPAVLENLDFGSMAGDHGIVCAQGACDSLGASLARSPLGSFAELPEAVAWSGDGKTAALYSASGEWLQVWHGLPETPVSEPRWSTSSLGGRILSVALSPDGGHLLLGVAGEAAGVYEVTGEGVFVPFAASENPVKLAFAANGKSVYALDAAVHAMVEIETDSRLSTSWTVEAIGDPVAFRVGTQEGRTAVYVAGASDHALAAYDARTHALLEVIPLSFAPAQIEPVSSGFLLNARASLDDVLWSYVPGRGALFVPVTPQIARRR